MGSMTVALIALFVLALTLVVVPRIRRAGRRTVSPRRGRGRQRGEHGGRERRQRGLVDGQRLVVERGLDHLQAQQDVALEPLRDDREHVTAVLGAAAHGFHERLGLLLARRLEERVDPALEVDQALGLDPEDQYGGGLQLVGIGHKWHHRGGGDGEPPEGSPQ